MNENYINQQDENLDTGSTTVRKSSIFKKIENFWYHYKWHSVISLFLIFTVTICTLQMCKKVDYDMHVLYASDKAINRTSSGDVSDFSKINGYLTRAATDTNGDGEVKLAFKDLYVLNEKQLADEELSESDYQRAYNDSTALGNMMLSSEYYVCLFSKDVYEDYRDSKNQPLMNLNDKSIFADASDIPYCDDSKCGILLSDTSFSDEFPIAEILPEDTVLCLRRVPVAQISKSDYKKSINFLKSLVFATESK